MDWAEALLKTKQLSDQEKKKKIQAKCGDVKTDYLTEGCGSQDQISKSNIWSQAIIKW